VAGTRLPVPTTIGVWWWASFPWPLRNRRVAIPKRGGKVRVLGIPAIRDRVVQGALKLILEPIFEADFCNGSYGYRPRRTAQEAVARVDQDIVEGKTRVIDVDLAA
jgi:RNA-directed DNA polymerase